MSVMCVGRMWMHSQLRHSHSMSRANTAGCVALRCRHPRGADAQPRTTLVREDVLPPPHTNREAPTHPHVHTHACAHLLYARAPPPTVRAMRAVLRATFSLSAAPPLVKVLQVLGSAPGTPPERNDEDARRRAALPDRARTDTCRRWQRAGAAARLRCIAVCILLVCLSWAMARSDCGGGSPSVAIGDEWVYGAAERRTILSGDGLHKDTCLGGGVCGGGRPTLPTRWWATRRVWEGTVR